MNSRPDLAGAQPGHRQSGTGPAHHAARRGWLAAAVLIIGALMDMIDLTIVNVALPTIRRDLHASATSLEWVISGYMLAFAASLIIAGSLGDRLGRKRVFLFGVGLFGLASLAAGVSQTAGELIACRVVQGAGAAAMAPQVLATFRTIFAPKERGQAFGLYGAMLGVASAVGLLVGGVLTQANLFGWSWRSVFFVNVPVAVIALAAGVRLIPETRDPAARRPDLPGGVLLAASLVAIVYPLLEGRELGWPWWTWVLLAAGMVGLGLLASREAARRRPGIAPLLQPRLFKIPAFSAGLGVQLMFSAGIQGFFLTFALWLQAGEHFSPLRAGVTAVAFSVGSFLVAAFAVPMALRYGRRVLVIGAALMVAGMAGVLLGSGHVTTAGNPWAAVPGLVVAGAGLSLLVIPLVNVVLAAAPASAAGAASGLFSTAQQLGGALGVAVAGTVYFGYLGQGHSFAGAFRHTGPYSLGAFALCGLFALLLPRTAVSDDVLTGAEEPEVPSIDAVPAAR